AYQRLAEAHDTATLDQVRDELVDRFGPLPQPVQRLLDVATFRLLARRAGVTEVVVAGNHVRFSPVELPESRTLRLTRLHPGTLVKPAVRTILVPRPSTARVGGTPLRDAELLAWASELVRDVLLDEPKGTP
ncbi:MAG: TRCF domain-containing protein, partial [Actinomycetes bacterium]